MKLFHGTAVLPGVFGGALAAVLLLCLAGGCSRPEYGDGQRREETSSGDPAEKQEPLTVRGGRTPAYPASTCSLTVDTLSSMYAHSRALPPYCFYSRGKPVKASRREGKVREVSLQAFCFGFSSSHLVFRKGERVRLFATSRDNTHSICIREYGIDVPVYRGEVKRIEFTADKAGQFIIRCTVYCGEGCRGMQARMVVEE